MLTTTGPGVCSISHGAKGSDGRSTLSAVRFFLSRFSFYVFLPFLPIFSFFSFPPFFLFSFWRYQGQRQRSTSSCAPIYQGSVRWLKVISNPSLLLLCVSLVLRLLGAHDVTALFPTRVHVFLTFCVLVVRLEFFTSSSFTVESICFSLLARSWIAHTFIPYNEPRCATVRCR